MEDRTRGANVQEVSEAEMNMRTCERLALLAMLVSVGQGHAGPSTEGASSRQTTGWRGDGSGVYPGARPPIHWSSISNVVWKTALPSWSNASPALAPDRLFVVSEPHTLLCLDRADGRILWTAGNGGEEILTPEQRERWNALAPQRAERTAIDRELKELRKKLEKTPDDPEATARRKELDAKAAQVKTLLQGVVAPPVAGGHNDTGGTTATPTVDNEGRQVYVFFGSGVVASYRFDGTRRWIRALPIGSSAWGVTPSPLLIAGNLVVLPGDLTALDPETGATRWTVRSGAKHGSPLAVSVAGAACVATPSGQLVNAATGQMVASGLPSLPYNTPIVRDGVLYYVGVDEGKVIAVRLPATPDAKPATLWTTEVKKGRYYGSPVFANGLVFALRQSGETSAIDAVTGEKKSEHPFPELGGQCFPSLAVAGDYLFACSDNGRTLVLKPTAELTLVAKNPLEGMRACPVFDGNRLYLRGAKNLYCISEP